MAKVKNISNGPRGAYNKGALVMAEAGEVIEADDYPKEWFKAEGKGGADDDAGNPDDLPRNVPKLRAIAKAEEIDLGEAKSADELIAVIKAAREAKVAEATA